MSKFAHSTQVAEYAQRVYAMRLYGREEGAGDYEVEVTVDLGRLALALAQKAARNKLQRSKAMRGAVIVRVRRST